MWRLLLIGLGLTWILPLHAQTTIPVKNYGQELVDQVVGKNPGLLVVVMHVSTPALPNYPIIASNIGRYGKVADEDDMRVINTEKTNLEVAHGGARFEVELVMREINGNNIGALGLVFPFKAGDDKGALEKKAIVIRDALARRILSAESLVEPYPIDASVTTKTHAQKLVDETYAKHKELNLIGLHVNMPKRNEHIILASTFGRIGKKTDEEMDAIKTGEPRTEVKAKGKRFGVQLPLLDASGKAIGAMTLGYPYKQGDDEKALVAKAVAVRDEMQRRIPTVESLVELDP